MIEHLEGEIAQLLTQAINILTIDRLQDLVGLFEQVGLQRFMGLLPVPRTPVRRPESGHEADKV